MLRIVGFGSGAKDNMTLEASVAIAGADRIVGYTTYVDILKQYFPDKEYYSTNMIPNKSLSRCFCVTSQNITMLLSLLINGIISSVL